MLSEKAYRAAVRILRTMEGKGEFRTRYADHIKTEFAEIRFRDLPVVDAIDRARDIATLAIAIGGRAEVESHSVGLTDEVAADITLYVTTKGRVLTADGERIEDEEDEDADDVASRVFG